MTRRDSEEQMDTQESDSPGDSGDMRSGNPNAVDPDKTRSREHKSGYGGEGGEPRTSSDERQREPK